MTIKGLYVLRPIALLLLFLLPVSIRSYEFFILQLNSSISGFSMGLSSDLIATLLAYFVIFYFRSIWLSGFILFLWLVANYANFEFVVAMNQMVSYRDLHFLLDAEFVSGSAIHISYPILLFGCVILSLVVLMIKYRQLNDTNQAYKSAPVSIVILCFVLGFFYSEFSHANIGMNTWVRYNVLHKNTLDLYYKLKYDLFAGTDSLEVNKKLNSIRKQDLSGKKIIKENNNKENVLIVIMEGIPGAYISKNTDFLKLNSPITMKHLSQQAYDYHAMTIPNFAVHAQQTIRGLYAILCGDFPKLTGTTPKAYQALNIKKDLNCLPEILADNGYQTIYMQGAGLEFMAKDKFMPRIGFQKVYGKSFFKKQYVDFNWGIDDKAFFEQAADYIETLDQTSPWFLTLLTVGGHHPYGVSDSFAAHYPSRKEASIHYADQAVANFIDRLHSTGVDKNTLIIITSDESHGVVDYVLSIYWGLGLIFSSQELPELNSDFFSHIDLSVSILDYLAISIPKNLSGRSIFRSYDESETILFGGEGLIFEMKKGELFWVCDLPGQYCGSFVPGSDNLFGNSYGKPSDKNYVKAQKIRKVVAILDQSIGQNKSVASYDLSSKERLKLMPDKWHMTSGGQYFSVAKESYVTVHFIVNTDSALSDAEFEVMYKVFNQDGSLSTKVFTQEGIKAHETLSVKLAFVVPENTRLISSNIEVKILNGTGNVFLEKYLIRVVELDENNPEHQAIDRDEFDLQSLSLLETQDED